MNQSNSEDVFSYYMNAFATTLDPHTNYMSPRQAEVFDIEMKLSLEGIGAVLQNDDVYTKVVSVVPMGPADRSKQVNPEDKIVGVAQGDGAFEDVIGWRLDDVVAKIKGKAGSVVRLEVLPKANAGDGKTKIVSITREKVKLEDQAAKSSIKTVEDQGRKLTIGVIDVPKFYVDFQARAMGDENYKSVARDVRDLITKLKAQKIDGIVLDLRNNGGGGLDEAAMMTGLFIDHGPVVQERDAVGSINLVDDDEPGVTWSGPLAVLVNGQSASASEIVAAALQDYGRAVIIGEPTFGKGTVQQMFDLNRLRDNNNETLGQIKYTLQKFYRITGQSTQHRGVLPDISLPTIYDQAEFGEGSLPNALPWDFVPQTKFTIAGHVQKWVPQLKSLHIKRVAKDTEYQYVLADVAEYNQRRKDKTISLNEQDRRVEREKSQVKELSRENARRVKKGLAPLKSLPENELAADEVLDVRLNETANIVADMVKLHASKRLVATGK
jgi:carboxyl-terminal processing protease